MNAKFSSDSSGFTLLEVMIALTIFVTIALTLSQTASQSVDSVLYMQNKTLASMLAANQLNEQRLKGIPKIGESHEMIRFANQEWYVATQVEKTDFPDTVRITLNVSEPLHKEAPLISLASIVGSH